ncbi:MAG: quinone-dependent dihydroorotate dehydrogenase [Flavobacteriales bacterium]|nr:quinone-dependent dihydroorotate dehydrogenase [Flavobacteriales bacterium]
MYKHIIRPILFRFSAEKAHNMTFLGLKILQKIPFALIITKAILGRHKKELETEVFGIKFPSPVGLAAGLDKDAQVYDALNCLGFSFVEIGTVTPKAQIGNPAPRLFRLIADRAIINRMGFNNLGVEQMVQRLKKRRTNVIIGGNIGKNKVTPNQDAVSDYLKSFEALYPYVDYFAVNVSSPNTPNLRALQEKEPLTALLSALMTANKAKEKAKPILLKIAPDLTHEQIDDIIEIVENTGIAGVIATNTTISRELIFNASEEKVEKMGAGGLSGMPLTEKSTEVIRYIHERSGGRFPIIGVGGIMSAEDAVEKLEAGASLVQLYTGFIYEGPSLIRRIDSAVLAYRRSKQI